MKFPTRFALVFIISTIFFAMQTALAPAPLAQKPTLTEPLDATATKRPTSKPNKTPSATNTSIVIVVPSATDSLTPRVVTVTDTPSPTITGITASPTNTASRVMTGTVSPTSDPGNAAPAVVADPADGQDAATAQPTSPPSSSQSGDLVTIVGEPFSYISIGLVLILAAAIIIGRFWNPFAPPPVPAKENFKMEFVHVAINPIGAAFETYDFPGMYKDSSDDDEKQGSVIYTNIILKRGYTSSGDGMSSAKGDGPTDFSTTNVQEQSATEWKGAEIELVNSTEVVDSEGDLDIHSANSPGDSSENAGDSHIGNYNFKLEIGGANAASPSDNTQINQGAFDFILQRAGAQTAGSKKLADKGFGFVETGEGAQAATSNSDDETMFYSIELLNGNMPDSLRSAWAGTFSKAPIAQVAHQLAHVHQQLGAGPASSNAQTAVGANQDIQVGTNQNTQLRLQSIEGKGGVILSKELNNLVRSVGKNSGLPQRKVRHSIKHLAKLIWNSTQAATDNTASNWMKIGQLNSTGSAPADSEPGLAGVTIYLDINRT